MSQFAHFRVAKVIFQLKLGLSCSFTFAFFWKNYFLWLPDHGIDWRRKPTFPRLTAIVWARSLGKQAVLGKQDPRTMSHRVCVPSVFPPPFRIFKPSLPRSAVLWMAEQALWPWGGSSCSHSWLAPGEGAISFKASKDNAGRGVHKALGYNFQKTLFASFLRSKSDSTASQIFWGAW